MGFGLQEGLMIRNAILDMKDRQKKEKFNAEYNKHLGGLQQDFENYKPEGEYDPKALNQARVAFLGTKIQEQEFQKGVFEHQKAQIDSQYQKSLAFYRQAEAAHAAKDKASEVKAYELAYENVFDGMDMKLGADGKSYTITDKLTGESTTQEFKDSQTMRRTLRGMAEELSVEGKFAQQAMQARMKRAMINADQEWQPLTNSKGEKAWRTRQYNNDTGEIDMVYEIQGQRVSAEEARKRGFTTLEDEKTMAEIYYKRKAGRAAGLGKGKTEGDKRTRGALEKTAEGYVAAYGVSLKEGMDMAREDQSKGNVATEIAKYIVDEMLDLSKSEDVAELRQYREQLLSEFKPTEPSTEQKKTGAAKGLPKAEGQSRVLQALQKQFPDAPDGTTKYLGKQKFIKEGGNWKQM